MVLGTAGEEELSVGKSLRAGRGRASQDSERVQQADGESPLDTPVHGTAHPAPCPSL